LLCQAVRREESTVRAQSYAAVVRPEKEWEESRHSWLEPKIVSCVGNPERSDRVGEGGLR
jgi:hypothetical protein